MQICEYNYKRLFLSFQRKHREVLLEREAEQKHVASMTHYFKPSSVSKYHQIVFNFLLY